MIISVHIPKTAGTSLRVGLERCLGPRLLLDYDDRPLSRSPEDEDRRARSAAAVRTDLASLLRDYDAVHGHFVASKYLPLGRDARFAVFLREPVARTLSQYRHWRRTPEAPNPVARRIRDEGLGPAAMAALPEYRGIYADFLGGIGLDRFAFVGLAEDFAASVALFEAVFGITLPVLHENAAADTGAPEVGPEAGPEFDPDEIARVKAAQAENAVIYDQARRRFDELCSAFL